MVIRYPRSSQLLILGLYSRIIQNGPPLSRTSLESLSVSPFFVKKLRALSTPDYFIRKFIEACVLPLILYCSPAISPGLLKHNLAPLKRSIKLTSQVCGLSFSYLTNLVCERHIKVSSRLQFAKRILGDNQHSLHDDLSNARSHTSTRSRFKMLPSKTAVYRNSVLPALSRLLVDRNAELNHYVQNLS